MELIVLGEDKNNKWSEDELIEKTKVRDKTLENWT